MKLLKIIGWIFIPYILIFIFWKKCNTPLRIAASIWSIFAIAAMLSNAIETSNKSLVQAQPNKSVVTTSAPEVIVSPKSTESPKIEAVASETPSIDVQTGKFNPSNPVTDVYLKDYLTFMNDFYLKIHDIAYSGKTIDDVEWSTLLAKNNADGWKKYQDITYVTDINKEKPKQFQSRTDVAQVWVMLSSLDMDYDTSLRGKYKDVKQSEIDYLDAYKTATGHFK
jgi:hypothetical protein